MKQLRARSMSMIWMAAVIAVAALIGLPIGNNAQASGANTRLDPGGTTELAGANWLAADGVDVKSNGDSSSNDWGTSYVNGTAAGSGWQCVELINRLYLTHGWISTTWHGNGNQMYANAPSYLLKQPQGAIGYVAPGDVVSLDNGGFGHADVVSNVTTSADGSRVVELVNQNTATVAWDATLSGHTLSVPGYTVLGVVHSPQASVSRMAVTRNRDGRLEMFAIGQHWEVYHRWQTTAGGAWSAWAQLDGSVSGLTAQTNADGRVELFAIGLHGEVYHRWQRTAGGTWSAWAQFDGNVSSITVARNQDGRLELFAVGHRGEVYHRWQASPGGAWSAWARMDGSVSNLTVATNANGRVTLFAVGLRGEVYGRTQTSPGGTWSGWTQFDGTVHRLSAARNADGRLELFAVGLLGEVYHRWQTSPGGHWSAWAQYDGSVSNIAVQTNQDGRLEMFAIGQLGEVYHRWQTTAGGTWSAWASFDGSLHT